MVWRAQLPGWQTHQPLRSARRRPPYSTACRGERRAGGSTRLRSKRPIRISEIFCGCIASCVLEYHIPVVSIACIDASFALFCRSRGKAVFHICRRTLLRLRVMALRANPRSAGTLTDNARPTRRNLAPEQLPRTDFWAKRISMPSPQLSETTDRISKRLEDVKQSVRTDELPRNSDNL